MSDPDTSAREAWRACALAARDRGEGYIGFLGREMTSAEQEQRERIEPVYAWHSAQISVCRAQINECLGARMHPLEEFYRTQRREQKTIFDLLGKKLWTHSGRATTTEESKARVAQIIAEYDRILSSDDSAKKS